MWVSTSVQHSPHLQAHWGCRRAGLGWWLSSLQLHGACSLGECCCCRCCPCGRLILLIMGGEVNEPTAVHSVLLLARMMHCSVLHSCCLEL